MSRDITKLHPDLRNKLVILWVLCRERGLKIGVSDCLRTAPEQDALYAQGRTAPGAIVTNARGCDYKSQHQWGIAFDFYQDIRGHAYDDPAFFEQVGALAKSIGLGWGGDWVAFRDRPHLYLPDWGSDTALLRSRYITPEAFRKTWKAAPIDRRYAFAKLRMYAGFYLRRFCAGLKNRLRFVKTQILK